MHLLMVNEISSDQPKRFALLTAPYHNLPEKANLSSSAFNYYFLVPNRVGELVGFFEWSLCKNFQFMPMDHNIRNIKLITFFNILKDSKT